MEETTTVEATQAGAEGIPTSAPSKPRVFDRNDQFPVAVQHPDAPGGYKIARVRFPTDAEWCARQRQLVQVRKSLSGDQTRTDIPRVAEVNEQLFTAIRVDDGLPKFDAAESLRGMERLERCVPTDVSKHGVEYTITMLTFNKRIVTHVLKVPTQKQLMDFGRSAVNITGRRQTTETRIALEPSGELWTALVQSVDGYPGNLSTAVPIIHQDAAINELLLQVSAETEDFDPEALGQAV